jgi:hypothetical protein
MAEWFWGMNFKVCGPFREKFSGLKIKSVSSEYKIGALTTSATIFDKQGVLLV